MQVLTAVFVFKFNIRNENAPHTRFKVGRKVRALGGTQNDKRSEMLEKRKSLL